MTLCAAEPGITPTKHPMSPDSSLSDIPQQPPQKRRRVSTQADEESEAETQKRSPPKQVSLISKRKPRRARAATSNATGAQADDPKPSADPTKRARDDEVYAEEEIPR